MNAILHVFFPGTDFLRGKTISDTIVVCQGPHDKVRCEPRSKPLLVFHLPKVLHAEVTKRFLDKGPD